jgi:hypothetical protein
LWTRRRGDRARDLEILLDISRRAAALDPGTFSARLLQAAEAEHQKEALHLERRKLMNGANRRSRIRRAAAAGILGAVLTVPLGAGEGR